jgi:hypothetical protein
LETLKVPTTAPGIISENLKCHGILLSHKERSNYVICRKIGKLEIIMLNEISQAQKAKYCNFTLFVEPRPKMMMTTMMVMIMGHECLRRINKKGRREEKDTEQ